MTTTIPAVAPTIPATPPTPSPEDRFKSAELDANSAIDALQSEVDDSRKYSEDPQKQYELGHTFLNGQESFHKQIKIAGKQQEEHAQDLQETAESAATSMSGFASQARDASRSAGVNSSIYMAEYEHRMALSQHIR